MSFKIECVSLFTQGMAGGGEKETDVRGGYPAPRRNVIPRGVGTATRRPGGRVLRQPQ